MGTVNKMQVLGKINIFILFYCCHVYPSFKRKRIASLSYGWDVCTRLGVAISDVSGSPVFSK